MRTLCALLLFVVTVQMRAQETYAKVGINDHIAVDAGVYLPFGSVANDLGLSGSFGFGVHFWKAFNENTFGVASVGNMFMPLGSDVQTDSGRQDLSNYTLNITPLLGGVGYAFSVEGLRPFVILLGGAQFVTLELTKNRPAEEFHNQAYFSLGGSAGASYPVNHWLSILATVRYLHMFDAKFDHVDITLGTSFLL